MSGSNIYLRQLTLDDVSQKYLTWMNDEDVNMYLESRWSSHSINSLRQFVETMVKSSNNYLFGIFTKDDDKHIGNIKIGPINQIHRFASIRLFIGDKNYWGKGIATSAIKQITDFAFNEINLHKVTAGMYESNTGSFNAFMKNGFVKVGVYTKHLFSGGNYQNEIILEKINEKI